MGSYNISCFVSKVTIDDGDDVIIFPLKSNTERSGFDQHLWSVSDLFIPQTFAIPATYDDCGSFRFKREDIDNILILEGHYNCKIEDLIDIENEKFDGLAVMHKSIYETLIKQGLVDYNGKPDKLNFESKYDSYCSEFAEGRKAHEEEKIYWNKVAIDRTKTSKDRAYAKEVLVRCQAVDDGERPMLIGGTSGVIYQFRDFENINVVYGRLIDDPKCGQSAIDFAKLIRNMYSSGLNFTPSLMGSQCGNLYMNKLILNASKKIVMNKLKERK